MKKLAIYLKKGDVVEVQVEGEAVEVHIIDLDYSEVSYLATYAMDTYPLEKLPASLYECYDLMHSAV